MPTPSVEFLPGDRVVTAGRQADKNRKGVVTNPTTNGAYICWDGEGGSTVMYRSEFERQPIEPGCHVRWLKPAITSLAGRIVAKVETSDWAGVDIITFTDKSEVYASDVVRVADPEPVWRDSGMRIDVSAEGGTRVSVGEPPTPPHDMEELREGIRQAAAIFTGSNPFGYDHTAWLARFAPAPPASFKRGDLVRGGIHHYNARIITLDVRPGQHEVIYVEGPFPGYIDNVDITSLRHVK